MRGKLSLSTQTALLQDFCEAFVNVHTLGEAIQFLSDLLTKRELTLLAKRLRVAKLLLQGKEYRAIEELLCTSHSTIAKVAAWLAESGEGFRLVTERAKNTTPPASDFREASEWDKLKRRYPAMFWPQLLLEEVVKSARKRDRERITQAVQKLDHKSKLYFQLRKALAQAPQSGTKYAAT